MTARRLHRKARAIALHALLSLPIIAYFLFLLTPLVIAVPVSFSKLAVFPPNALTVQWYVAFFTSNTFYQAWRVSLITAAASAAIATVIGAGFALAMTRGRSVLNAPARRLLVTVMLSPLIVPGVATGIGLVFYFTYIGLVNGWARLIVAHVIITMPYVVRVMISALQEFDSSIEEAASNLGASDIRVFLTITLPVVRSGVVVAFILAFMASFEELSVTAFVTQPGMATLPVVLFGYIQNDFNPVIAVVSTVMTALAALVMLTVDRVIGIDRVLGLKRRSRDAGR